MGLTVDRGLKTAPEIRDWKYTTRRRGGSAAVVVPVLRSGRDRRAGVPRRRRRRCAGPLGLLPIEGRSLTPLALTRRPTAERLTADTFSAFLASLSAKPDKG